MKQQQAIITKQALRIEYLETMVKYMNRGGKVVEERIAPYKETTVIELGDRMIEFEWFEGVKGVRFVVTMFGKTDRVFKFTQQDSMVL